MDVVGAGDHDDVIQLLREHMQQSIDKESGDPQTDSSQPPFDQTTHPSDQTTHSPDQRTISLRSRVSQVMLTVQWEAVDKKNEFMEEMTCPQIFKELQILPF